jgi:hypothetical protein
MIERATNSDINEGFTLRLTAGNDIALPDCPANVLETVPPSTKSHRHPSLTCENPLMPTYYDGGARRQRRAQPPAHNNNPHSVRRTT